MRNFLCRIDELVLEIKESIKTILHNNNLSKLDINKAEERTDVVWWDQHNYFFASQVMQVLFDGDELSLVVEGKNSSTTLYEDDFALRSPIWLATLQDSIISELQRQHGRVCYECGKPMCEDCCFKCGKEYFCSYECLYKHYSPDEWSKMYADGKSENY